jgi:pimeloyl-ACP methyl ester carboxylesterase
VAAGVAGKIDFEWDAPATGSLLRELATFSRVITHDQRGIGLSSRNLALPDLETRVMDLRTVLDSAGADRVVLLGAFTSGSVNALLAATDPARVHSLVWIEPSPRSMWAPDYPWGVGADYHEADRAALAYWGTSEYGRRFTEYQVAFGNEIPLEWAEPTSRQSRNACTPDIAEELSSIWYASDVRAILPAVRCPTLLLSRGEVDDSDAKYVASLMPSATLRSLTAGG